MIYVISEILVYLFIAFIFGLIIGWLLRKYCSPSCLAPSEIKKPKKKEKKYINPALDIKSGDLGLTNAATGSNTKKAPVKKKSKTSKLTGNAGLDIETIEGIGKVFGTKLRAMDIDTTGALIASDKKAPKKLRTDIEDSLGVKPEVVSDWVSMADLLRVEGIDKQYSELLVDSGIGSVAKLAKANAASLATKTKKINSETSVSPKVPSAAEIKDWIKIAKEL